MAGVQKKRKIPEGAPEIPAHLRSFYPLHYGVSRQDWRTARRVKAVWREELATWYASNGEPQLIIDRGPWNAEPDMPVPFPPFLLREIELHHKPTETRNRRDR